MKKSIFASLACIALASGSAVAADKAPVYKARPPAVVSDGWYAWVDGSYQNIRLPTYDVGIKSTTPQNFSTPAAAFDPRATGASVSGGVGYILPTGSPLALFGARTRIEFGGSYVSATASQNAAFKGPGFALVTVTGIESQGAACGGPGCLVASTLQTTYKSWQGSAKMAGDFHSGAVTFTPWAMIFGGSTGNNQSLTQLGSFGGSGVLIFTYAESSSLNWVDFGPKLGLEATSDLAPWLGIGFGGSLGVADRSVSLSANDMATLNPVFSPVFTPKPAVTAISSSTDTAAFLANAQANLFIRPSQIVELRGFAGLNYDSRVPGISAPLISGPAGHPGVQGTPAGLKFAAETSYYAGGGVKVKFAP